MLARVPIEENSREIPDIQQNVPPDTGYPVNPKKGPGLTLLARVPIEEGVLVRVDIYMLLPRGRLSFKYLGFISKDITLHKSNIIPRKNTHNL